MYELSGFQVEFDKLVKESNEAKELHNHLDQEDIVKDNLTLLERVTLLLKRGKNDQSK